MAKTGSFRGVVRYHPSERYSEARVYDLRKSDGSCSLAGWATASYLLLEDGRPIGLAAIHFTPGIDEAAEVRLALLPSPRQPLVVWYLVEAAIALVFSAKLY